MRSYNSSKCHACIVRASVGAAVFLFSALLAIVPFPGSASAEIIADLQQVPGVPGLFRDLNSYTLDEINAKGGIVIGDKLFKWFDVVSTESVGAIAPTSAGIKITAFQISGDYGMQFSGGWLASVGQLIDSTIEFHASILPEYVDLGYAFKDNALYLAAYENDTEAGEVSISENLYTEHPAIPGSQPFAKKLVYYVNDENQKILDLAEFAPVTEMWIVKDVIVSGGDVGDTGAAHLSRFYQTFSQIPEPGTLVLLGFGAIGLAAYAWRKRR